ncbi:MAG: Dipeptide-binding transporter, periplasmic substrate-binding component [Labilithrix sp.]|nr:Dipeptide-binding transporter, periplasmic substrate-binding component [Labilithrix sp.]
MRSILARCSAALALWLVACSQELPAPTPRASSEDALPRQGGTLVSASFGDIRTVDPANVADGLVPQVLEGLFAGLVDYDLDGKIQPELAESWTTSADGLATRFVLRQGSRFHDGEEVTADDVKRSVERALHPSAPNPYASYFASITGFAAYAAGKSEHLAGVTTEGRYVVTFHLDAPDAAFLPLLAMQMLRPVCRSGGSRYSDAWEPCGAGPFKLLPGGWDRGRQITIVRHDRYFRPGLPHLDAVRLVFHTNLNAQRFKLLSGDQDILRESLTPDLLKLQADPRWRPFGAYEAEKQIGGMSMNVEMAPFDNVEIRRAVASALDRDQIRMLRASNLRAATGPVPPSVEGYDPELAGQKYDLGAALEHMRRAGYPYDPATGQGGWPHVIPYLAYTQGLDEYLIQVTQQMLAKIGIRIEIRLVNYPSFLALRARRHEVAFGAGYWQQDYPEAGSFLEPLFTSRAISESDSNNWSFYQSPRVDELVENAKHELDPGKRKKLYTEAQGIICDEAPWAFTHFYRFYDQWQPYVRGFRPHPLWATDPREIWIDRAAGPVAARALFSGSAAAKLLGDGLR